MGWGDPSTAGRVPDYTPSVTSMNTINSCLHPFWDAIVGQNWLCLPAPSTHFPLQWHFFYMWSFFAAWGAELGTGQGLGHVLRLSWSTGQRPEQFLYASPSLFPRISKHVCNLHRWSLDFFQLSCTSHWLLNQPRGLIFPGSKPRAEVPSMWWNAYSPGRISKLI